MSKSIKNILAILVLFLGVYISEGYGQQLPIFTQFSEYGGLINPSHIAFDAFHYGHNSSAGVSYRDQWTQLPDRPRTLAARYESSTTRRRGVNLTYGGFILHDEIGVFTTTEVKGRVSGFFRTSGYKRYSGISVGLNLGLGQYRANLSELAYVELDPILFRENSSLLYPDVGVGISYINEFRNKDYLQVGIGVPQIFSLDHTYTNDRKEFDIQRLPHLYVSSSYYKMLGDDTFLEFSGWVKRVKNIPLNYDFICRYRFADNMWLGIGANNSGIIHTEAGIILHPNYDSQCRIGYAFNPTFYTHSVIFGNIHELNLSYSFSTR